MSTKKLTWIPAEEFDEKWRVALEATKIVLQEYATAAEQAGDEARMTGARLATWAFTVGFREHLQRVERDSLMRHTITTENFLAGWNASRTGSDAEIAAHISRETGKTLSRQAVQKFRKQHPELARPTRK